MAATVKMYTRKWCGYCTAAARLLRAKGVAFDEIDVTGNTAQRAWLRAETGQHTVPQIFINGESIGGYDELSELERDGALDRMLATSDRSAAG